MIAVVHANWSRGRLHLWAEIESAVNADPAVAARPDPPAVPETEPAHPFAAGAHALGGLLGAYLPAGVGEPSTITILVPACAGRPIGSTAAPGGEPVTLEAFRVGTVAVPPAQAPGVLDRLDRAGAMSAASPDGIDQGGGEPGVTVGRTVGFFAAAARLARQAVAQQRYVPMILQDGTGSARAAWQPWPSDEKGAARVAVLFAAMPPAARAARDEWAHEAWPILDDFLRAVADATCRTAFAAESLTEAIEGRDGSQDAAVAWLGGLLGPESRIAAGATGRAELARTVRRWVAGLEERGAGGGWRLLLRLSEPTDSGSVPDLRTPPESIRWPITFHLRAADDPELVVDAADLWLVAGGSVTIEGRRLEHPQELLLAELARAARVYRRLDSALQEAQPTGLELSTAQAYEFLREQAPLLAEQGFGVESPPWWDSPTVRLGVRLHLDSPAAEEVASAGSPASGPGLGMDALVGYRWEISLGGAALTLQEFEHLARLRAPLVRIGGRWVEVRPEDFRAAMDFIRDNPGGTMRVAEAMRLAYGVEHRRHAVPIVGVESTGWIGALFGDESVVERIPAVAHPREFHGALRPYQLRGVSWLAFLERLGLGACLADDMGLGKTVQVLALLVHEREQATAAGSPRPGPTLLVVPMSVVGNWAHEARRFCPQVRLMVHHGVDRRSGDDFVKEAMGSDAVVTTYALAHRDQELLSLVPWGRVVLDEAQSVKNPQAKQSQAVRGLESARRVALTGTPVENRLSELWSIMDFLNPGYLGGAAAFRQRFVVPIERMHDPQRGRQLRSLVQPFILRRLKTDPTVVSDLPEKIESREYCHLSAEQAALYESCVQRMLGEIDRTEGIHRRGLVLAALIRLKQICNHPSQVLHDTPAGRAPAAARSGKCSRLMEMLDEALATGAAALVFTQFRQMGALLAPMIRDRIGRDVLFLHGGVPQAQRDELVRRFQSADGTAPILVASLKAGGVGLNLTAATHVFHFDRWWNPAVENQATDRAYRIGQTRAVQVHKFITSGTLEERIDEMIEQKTELAERIIGSGERWLTELDTRQLRELFALRRDAVGVEE